MEPKHNFRRIPQHIGVIPDGNRRYARKNKLSLSKAYELGVNKVREFLRWCREYDIKYVSIYVLSHENFIQRSREELQVIFSLMKKHLNDIKNDPEIHKNEIRIHFAGDRDPLPEDLKMLIHEIEIDTKNYENYHIILLINYGGRQEILRAVKEIIKLRYRPENITLKDIEKHLYLPNIPYPDLVIRTSGEMRISNFLIWQIAYSELYFSKKLWPEFSKEDFLDALREYERRERRYGK